MKNAMKKFSWKLAKNNLEQIFPSFVSNFIYVSLRISNWLWKKSPRLEKIILSPFYKWVKRNNLDEKAKFINQS